MFSPFAGFPPEMEFRDKSDLLLVQLLILSGRSEDLEVFMGMKGWSAEDLDRMLPPLDKWCVDEGAESEYAQPQGGVEDGGTMEAAESMGSVVDALVAPAAGPDTVSAATTAGSVAHGLKFVPNSAVGAVADVAEEEPTVRPKEGGQENFDFAAEAKRAQVMNKANGPEAPVKVTFQQFVDIYIDNKDYIDNELARAWRDGGEIREEGGFILYDPITGEVGVQRVPGGDKYSRSIKFPKNIPDNVIAVGNPCRVLRPITDADKIGYLQSK